MASIIHIHLGMIDRMELWPPSHPAQVHRPQFSYHLPQPLLIMLKLIILSLRHVDCQGTSETGNESHPSAHGTPTDLRNRRSRGRIPAECLEQKMLYVYATVCTQGDFTLSRK